MIADKKRVITLRLNDNLDDKITEVSKKLGISKNAFILTILNKEVANDAVKSY